MIVFTLVDKLARQSGALALAENDDHMKRIIQQSFAGKDCEQTKYPNDFKVCIIAEYEPKSAYPELKPVSCREYEFSHILGEQLRSDIEHTLAPGELK